MNRRRPTVELLCLVEDSKGIIRGNMAEPRPAATTEDVGKICLTEREENTSNDVLSTARTLANVESVRDEEKAAAFRVQPQNEQVVDSFATVAEVLEIAELAINTALAKLYECLIDTAKPTTINTLEDCDLDRYRLFVRRAVPHALGALLASTLQDDKKICDALETAVVQDVGTKNIAKEVAKVLVCDPAIVALIGTKVVNWLIRPLVGYWSKKLVQSHFLRFHLDLTVCRPKVKKIAARRVKRLGGRLVTVASYHVRHQRQTDCL